MDEITKTNICSLDIKDKNATNMILWIRGTDKNKRVRKRIVGIDVEDALKMVDDSKPYVLNEQSQSFYPKYVKGFDSEIGYFMGAVYDKTELVSNTEFREFCLKRLEIYVNRFRGSRKKVCELFFEQYMPKSVKEKYGTVWDMIKKYDAEIEKKVTSYYVERGGRFLGCYIDDCGRKRPITERKYMEKRYNFIDQLKICIGEEFRDESK